jgi:hypothetical protein
VTQRVDECHKLPAVLEHRSLIIMLTYGLMWILGEEVLTGMPVLVEGESGVKMFLQSVVSLNPASPDCLTHNHEERAYMRGRASVYALNSAVVRAD